MSIFESILEKLGMRKPEGKEPPKPAAPAAPVAPAVKPSSVQSTPAAPPPEERRYQYIAPAAATPPPPPKPVEMAHEDLVAHLDFLAKTGPIKGLNWRVSIHDFMALLGMEHTSEAIKDLAVELGCPEKEMADSYTRNVWTHKALMKKLAENGGNVPKELLD